MAEPVVNVEKIMEEIRREIQMEEALRDLPRFEDIPLDGGERPAPAETPAPAAGNVDWQTLEQSLDYINRNYDVPYYWPFAGSKVKTFLKRVVRRLAKCILAPIVSMQDAFNAHVVRVCNNLKEAIVSLMARADAHQSELARLRGELDELRGTLERQQTLLARQDEILTQQGETLAQQDEALTQQKQALEEQRAALTAQEAALTGAAGSVDALSGLVRETQDMLQVNDQRAADLERDMDCIRRVDGSIFTARETVDYNKYSQAGEDSIIAYVFRMLGYRPSEVSYLDLGANHARELSNTYYFYQQGASGVLVEANPDLIPELRLLRNRDTILNRCVSSTDDEMVDFYIVSGSGISSKEKASVEHAIAANPLLEVTETTRVKTVSVDTILRQYFPTAPALLNIDIEGSEMDVLTTWNFDQYRPLAIVIETIPYETHLVVGQKNEKIIDLLQKNGYVEYAFTGINSIFLDKRALTAREDHRGKAHAAPTDYYADMFTNERASRTPNGICLRPDGIAYGPYITCPAGEYHLQVKLVALDKHTPIYLDVMAETGTERITRFQLSDGENDLAFSLDEEKEKVEFVLHNETRGYLYLTRVYLR